MRFVSAVGEAVDLDVRDLLAAGAESERVYASDDRSAGSACRLALIWAPARTILTSPSPNGCRTRVSGSAGPTYATSIPDDLIRPTVVTARGATGRERPRSEAPRMNVRGT